MALNKDRLRLALLAMMNQAETEAWTKEQVADAMAGAIDGYVRAGAVSDVVVTLSGGTEVRQTNTAVLK
jgi:hypothetical protein